MAKVVVEIRDKDNNVVSEVPYGQNGITGVNIDGQQQQVYQDVDKEGNQVFLAAENFTDPFLKIGNQIDRTVSLQAPKVAITDNKITVSAPQEVLSSPLVAQVKEELKSLKGADLKSPETQNAINALNEEVENSIKDSMLQAATGWTREQYNDYQYARQSVRTTNPMKSANKIKGKDKEGNIVMKTPQEWIDYYRRFYNTDERTEAFKKSYQSNDPYERIMALVMGQGDETPVYGFDAAERMGQGWKAFTNQMGKFPEGMVRLLGEDTDTKRVEEIVGAKNIPVESMRKFNVNTEEQFEEKKKALEGKSWKDLSDDDKAFLVLLGVSREGELEKEADTTEAMKDYRGKKTNTFAWDTNEQDYKRAERKAARQISVEDLNNAVSDDEETSKQAISNILSNNSFDKYKTARNNYDTWQGYQDWTEEGEKELASTADWAGNEQWWGNLTGTIGRYLWENAVVQGLTGGLSMNAISDKIGAGIVSKLASHGIAPTSKLGKSALQFTANLVGTIPEDIVQTSVDNVLTYNEKENANLFNPEQMSENFKNNLIWMAGFNTLRAGISTIKRARMLRQAAKALDLDEELVIGMASDADDIARAVSKGEEIKVEGDKVSIVDNNGKETVMKNTTPEQAKIVGDTLEEYYQGTPLTRTAQEDLEIVKSNNVKTLEDLDDRFSLSEDYAEAKADGKEPITWIDNEEAKAMLNDIADRQQIGKRYYDGEDDYVNDFEKYAIDWGELTPEERKTLFEALMEDDEVRKYIEENNLKLEDENINTSQLRLIDQENQSKPVEATEKTPEVTKETPTPKDENYVEPVKKRTRKEWKENPTYDVNYNTGRAEDAMSGRIPLSDYLDEQKERMWEALKNSNQGVETFYHRDEFGNIDRRDTVSYNGTLYRQLYDEYGGKPTKGEFGEAFDDVIKNGEDSKYYYGFKEFDPEGEFDRGYNAGNEEIDTILYVKEEVESNPPKTTPTEEAGATAKITESEVEPETIKTTEDISEATEVETPKTEVETPKAEAEEPKVTVEVDTPDGPVRTETVDYRFNTIDDAIGPKVNIEATPAGTKHFHTKALNFVMDLAQKKLFRDFNTRFGDITTSEFDWIFHNSKNGMKPKDIIGTVDPVSGRTITQNTIDAAKWWGDHPIVRKLRQSSRQALGMEGDMNILGYLPHTSYDPANLSYDEALTGQLWREYTGKSTVGNDGKFIGYGGTMESRFRTFASNMLWDTMNNEVAAAKLIEEAQLDGKTLTPEQAVKAAEGGKEIQAKVNEAPSTKALTKTLSSDSGYDKTVFEEIDKKIKEEGPKSGLSKAYHDNYAEVYVGANGQAVQSQPTKFGKDFSQQGDTMRKIATRDGSMYDNGGADIVYASQNAVEIVQRFAREGGDFRTMLTEFIQNHSGRSPEYAEAIADRWIAKMNDGPGKLTKGKAILSLSSSMRAEGMSRLRRWLVRADYSGSIGPDGKRVGGFSASTRQFMDDFLFRHTQMDSVKNNRSIRSFMANRLNDLTSMRYRALFYGNIKNALLQVSELNRLFTVFKWGDASTMLKRLATDEGFRARVNTYIEAVSPETSYLDADLYDKYRKVSDSADVTNDGITFKKLKGGLDEIKDTADKIGLAPINAAETLKNRTMVAALVAEADRLGLSGDEALRHIRSRFERVALASSEMGRIGLASNPLAKPMLFLQNFQIRELGMHYYNIKDLTGMEMSAPKRWLNASKYITKVLGSKLATTLILARLGYSATQTLGIDPFGLANNYNRLSEDEMNAIDKQISGGVLTPFFSGGMTSLISDMYFMARAAYEDSNRKTISDDAEAKLNQDIGGGADWSAVFSLDNLANMGTNFVPGSTFANRFGQMNEMMDTGWALSSTGNKMYTAPQDWQNTLLGYLFGRSATENANQYNQTYGKDLGQTLSRTVVKSLADMFGGGYQQFDPIDRKNYSDWFDGSENDRQQFEKGRRYFQQERDRIIDAYEEAMEKSYSQDDISEAQNDMNQRLEELYEQLDRFVNAYEKKNGTMDPAMAKSVVNLLNTTRVGRGTQEEREQKGLEGYSDALERYSQRGYSPVGTYTGPTESEPEKELKYQGSPQYRTAISGKYNLNSEAVAVLKEADRMLEDERKAIKDAIDAAYDTEDWDGLKNVQKQYLEKFDKVVAPVIATYGSGVLSSTDVVNQIKDMLSTGTVSRSGDLIPSDQYRKDKYGKYRSMPLETVDVKKWAQQRYSDDMYKNPTVRSYSTADDDIMDIKRLIAQNKPDRARARALQLKVRVDNEQRTLSKTDYQWLLDFLNNGGK